MNVFNLSFGKDSMATLILAAEQGIPIDRVMYCEIKFNDEISGEHPLMAEWIPTAEKRLKELFGVTVDHAYCGYTFCDEFYRKMKKGKFIGIIRGFPMVQGAWCNSMKVIASRKYYKQFNEPVTEVMGIAYDEMKRWERALQRQTKNRIARSLLVEQKLTEEDAFEICKKYDLLSPIYTSSDGIYRGGCWFCPKQCMADLRALWENYPQLYNKLVEMEKDTVTTFRPDKVTLKTMSERFEKGYTPQRRKKQNKYKQMSLFDKEDK